MTTGRHSRRAILSTAPIVVASCLDRAGETEIDAGDETAGDGEDEADETTDVGREADDTGDCLDAGGDPEEQIEQLPDRRPLADVLVELFRADDRAAFAAERDLDYREGAVQVDLSLEPDTEPPTAYLPADRTEFGDTVIAFVDVDCLVALALDDAVRLVAPQFDPQPTQ